jgi:hypothetical protein
MKAIIYLYDNGDVTGYCYGYYFIEVSKSICLWKDGTISPQGHNTIFSKIFEEVKSTWHRTLDEAIATCHKYGYDYEVKSHKTMKSIQIEQSTLKACDCSIQILMTSGCVCGGNLIEEDARLEHEIIETFLAGHKEWRPDLHYPESHSDMQGGVRALLRMYKIERRAIAAPLRLKCPECNGVGKFVWITGPNERKEETCKKCSGKRFIQE